MGVLTIPMKDYWINASSLGPPVTHPQRRYAQINVDKPHFKLGENDPGHLMSIYEDYSGASSDVSTLHQPSQRSRCRTLEASTHRIGISPPHFAKPDAKGHNGHSGRPTTSPIKMTQTVASQNFHCIELKPGPTFPRQARKQGCRAALVPLMPASSRLPDSRPHTAITKIARSCDRKSLCH